MCLCLQRHAANINLRYAIALEAVPAYNRLITGRKMNTISSSPARSVRVWLVWVFVPLLLGVLASIAVPRPIIGIIYLDDAIYSSSARMMIAQIRYARETPQIHAVILVLNTPGGTVSDTESVYRELNSLRATKPVITVIESMAASGGYYLSSGTDYIYAKSSSVVGNIGVIGYMPSAPIIMEDIVSTGPYKLWGDSRDSQIREIDMHKQGFWQVVQLGRGAALKIPQEEVLSGKIWSGTVALRIGLVDELGTVSDALERAAQMSHIQHYQSVDLFYKILEEPNATQFFQLVGGVTTPYPQKAGIYMLYIPQGQEAQP